MQARGPLMIEHRLIEKMIKIIEEKIKLTEQEHVIDPYFVDTAVDFIRVYADQTHHGKEEDILFRDLLNKNLKEKDQKLMNELIEDHVFGRKTIKALVEGNTSYHKGDKSSLSIIVECLKTLVNFYPKHIKKEDDAFFPSSRNYFSNEEDQAMLAEFWEFDRKMIHEKYEAVVKELRNK